MNITKKYGINKVEILEKLIAEAQELYPMNIEKRKIYIKNKLEKEYKKGRMDT